MSPTVAPSAAGHLAVPPGRQGPGPLPAALVDSLQLSVARRAAGVLPGDRMGPGLGAGHRARAAARPTSPATTCARSTRSRYARTGIPHVREYVPERALTTWLVLDVSPSMAFGTADRLKSDVAEGAALVITRLALRHGGRIGAGHLRRGDRAARAPARRARRAGRRAPRARRGRRRSTAPCRPSPGHPSPLARTLARLRKLTANPGLIVVVSDLRGPRDWRPALSALGTKHAVLVVEVRDPREETLRRSGRWR